MLLDERGVYMEKRFSPYTCKHSEYKEYLEHHLKIAQSGIPVFKDKVDWLKDRIEEFSDRPDNVVYIAGWHNAYEILDGYDLSD